MEPRVVVTGQAPAAAASANHPALEGSAQLESRRLTGRATAKATATVRPHYASPPLVGALLISPRALTHSPVGPLPPNGQRVTFQLMNIFRYDDQDRLAEEWIHTDQRSVLTQLGAAEH
jgi:hypothetical protein